MCGRYTLTTPVPVLAERFGFDSFPELKPRYNVAPTQPVAVVVAGPELRRELVLMRWGLVPAWSREGPKGPPLINARSETAADRPAFRQALRSRRCLVPADGFFEWAKVGGRKQPHYFHRPNGEPFAFAGLWERWQGPEGDPLLSCAVLTTEANEVVRPVHDRMPVILAPEDFQRWLESGDAELLRPCPPEALAVTRVSALVNSPRNDGPECLRPVA